MPLQHEDLKTIIENINDKIDTYLGIAGQRPVLRKLARRVTQIISMVVGGCVYLLYLFLDEVAKQTFITTADDLTEHGFEYGVLRKPATNASGYAIAVGTTGNTIPVGTKLQNDNAYLYTVTVVTTVPIAGSYPVTLLYATDTVEEVGTERNNGDTIIFEDDENLPTGIYSDYIYFVVNKQIDDFQISEILDGDAVTFGEDGSGSYSLRALVAISADETGAGSNMNAGETLYFYAGDIEGIEPELKVDRNTIYGGADLEAIEDWRDRLLFRKKYPPAGGASFDYIRWALENPGVTRAWVIPEYLGRGTMGVAFVKDDANPIYPSSGELIAMKNYFIEHIDPATGEKIGMPAQAIPGLEMLSLTEYLIEDFDIRIYPNTAQVRAECLAALKDLIRREAGPLQTLYVSRVSEVISDVANEEYHRIERLTDQTIPAYQIGVLGNNITFLDYGE